MVMPLKLITAGGHLHDRGGVVLDQAFLGGFGEHGAQRREDVSQASSRVSTVARRRLPSS
jgi:hypothetical protein